MLGILYYLIFFARETILFLLYYNSLALTYIWCLNFKFFRKIRPSNELSQILKLSEK